MNRWLEERVSDDAIPFLGQLGVDIQDHRLRLFCHEVGIKMSPCLPRTAAELHQGLSEVIQRAQRSNATELTIISHSTRLERGDDIKLLKHWLNGRRGLDWIQAGCISSKRPTVLLPLGSRLNYRSALFHSIEDHHRSAHHMKEINAGDQRASFYWRR